MAWSCNNFYGAIQTLRLINPRCKIIIATDLDVKKESRHISIKKAYQCKAKFSNILIKTPEFEHFDSNHTDFNDLLTVSDEETVKNQLAFKKSDFTEILLLGYNGTHYYYFNTQTLQLTSLTAAQHTKICLLAIANQQYWGERYRFKYDKEGNETSIADFDYCIEKMFEEQREMGIFCHQNIRGRGVWIDKERIIVNIGDKQIVDGTFLERVPDTNYLYTSQAPLSIDWNNPLTDQESQKIVNLFKKLNYKTPGGHVYLAGFVALSQIFNAIDWRFQLWVTGGRGSGKTEVLKMMSKLIFNSEIMQSLTAAGIRQYLMNDAMPMLIDEAEPNSYESRKRMDAIIELIRQCSSRSSTKSLRGTRDGQALEFNVNSIFCLSSIQPYLPTQADVSRFFVVEMQSGKNIDSTKWPEIQSLFYEIENFAPRLFARMVKLLPTIRKNIETIKNLISESEFITEPRLIDQTSSLLGSYFALETSEELCDANFDFIIETLRETQISASEYDQENDVDEAENCLDTILDIPTPRRDATIGKCIELISTGQDRSEHHEALEIFGMKYYPEKEFLFIPANNKSLKKELSDTMYHDYSRVLKRHKNFAVYKNAKINGRSTKGLFVRV